MSKKIVFFNPDSEDSILAAMKTLMKYWKRTETHKKAIEDLIKAHHGKEDQKKDIT